jgi:hypothetical protein
MRTGVGPCDADTLDVMVVQAKVGVVSILVLSKLHYNLSL